MFKRTLAVAVAVAALSGCAHTGWTEYAAQNNCVATGASDVKKEMVMTNIAGGAGSSIGYGGGPSSFTAPTVSVRKVYQYKCDNGVIWAYAANTKLKE